MNEGKKNDREGVVKERGKLFCFAYKCRYM